MSQTQPEPKARCRPSEGTSSNPHKRAKRVNLPESSANNFELARASSVPTFAPSHALKTSGAPPVNPNELGANVLAAVVRNCRGHEYFDTDTNLHQNL